MPNSTQSLNPSPKNQQHQNKSIETLSNAMDNVEPMATASKNHTSKTCNNQKDDQKEDQHKQALWADHGKIKDGMCDGAYQQGNISK